MARAARRIVGVGFVVALATGPVWAAPRPPLPDFIFDGGVVSAETLGRGNTTASNRGTPASGSENPAALDLPDNSGSSYATALVYTQSHVKDDAEEAVDPLNGKVLQYFSVAGERGVLFFEPISRYRQTQVVDAAAGQERDVEYSANAIGFAGADKWHDGSLGVSIAYLFSSLNVLERTGDTIVSNRDDTGNGLRINIGARYPKGPAMFGLTLQNAPGFLWGKEFRRSQLPVRVRAGSTYKVASGILFSVEGERRFYHEGGNPEDYLYVGNESFVGKNLILRVGAFGTSLNRPEDRHLTAGLTVKTKTESSISYALEVFELDNEKVKRSFVSINSPFTPGD